jgi:uncharacterized phage protein gp47/JayE
MSLDTPTTKQISDNIIAQLQATLNQNIPLLPKSFLRVLAKSLAAVFILLYKYAGFMFLQIFVRTASNTDTLVLGKTVRPLAEWGRLIGVGDPIAATNAVLNVTVTVNTQSGSLPSGSALVGVSNGVTYVTQNTVLLDAPTVQVDVLAVEDENEGGGAGVIGNLEIGDDLTFVNPLANVDDNVVVAAQVVTGANEEDIELYRQRVIDRFRTVPQGGAYADYRQWGLEVAGIQNIFPYTGESPGEVDVYVLATVASSGDPDGIPTAAQLQAVLDSINLDDSGLASRRPANALVNTIGITRKGFDVEIDNLVVQDLATVQATIVAAVEAYFLEREPFIEGLDSLPKLDRISKNEVLCLVDEIVSNAGGSFDDAILKDGGVPFTLYTLAINEPLGELAKADSVTFI